MVLLQVTTDAIAAALRTLLLYALIAIVAAMTATAFTKGSTATGGGKTKAMFMQRLPLRWAPKGATVPPG